MDSDSDDDFVTYGTPRELDEDDITVRKRPKTLSDQIVKDKQGRQRFHGAFTGGFSAGFFNTVGSVEGWTPSTFKSTRSKRADNHGQKPEDFMDEEDTGEFGFAPKSMQVKNDYDSVTEENKKKRKFSIGERSALGHHALNSILKPARSSVGVRMLKKMGWRVGQGIGPRMTRKEKQDQRTEISRTKKMYGCSLPESEEAAKLVRSHSDSETTDSEDENDITFAPDDYDPFIVNPKSDCFGIGYKGLDRRSVLSNHFSLFEAPVTVKEKSKQLMIQGKGFGVGALEDDDEDIYAVDDISNYDFSLGNRPSTSKSISNSMKALPSSVEKIEGFVATSKTSKKKYFPPPKLPPGFQPIHVVKKSRFEPTKNDDDKSKKKRMTASDRSVIIGEAPSSVETLSKQVKIGTEIVEEENLEKITTKPVADGVFRPFVAYPDKQKRYEQYLVLAKNGKKDQLASLQPLSMTDWERERERLEFEQASKLYTPLSAAFSDRFVVASQADDSTDPLVEVKRTVDNQNDKREAAKRKMFGALTRTVRDWAPTSLLCKRFNIPDPNVRDTSSEKKKRPKFSVFNFLEASSYNAPDSVANSSEETTITIKEEAKYGENTEELMDETSEGIVNESENANDNNLTISKILETGEEPSSKEDLYKAIFLSSSEDESDGEEGSKEISISSIQSTSNISNTSKVVNALRNTSPPRGIFANLDLDALNSRKSDKRKDDGDDTKEKCENDKLKESVENLQESSNNRTSSVDNCDIATYGPALPSNPLPKEIAKPIVHFKKSKDSHKWVELTRNKKNKKHKKERRSKSHHKHKKSKKHKR